MIAAIHHAFGYNLRGEIAGELCHGSPWISGPLVRQSCLTAHTVERGSLGATITAIGHLSYGPAEQVHDCLPVANRVEAATTRRAREINHDQNHVLRILEGGADFCPRENSAHFAEHLISGIAAEWKITTALEDWSDGKPAAVKEAA